MTAKDTTGVEVGTLAELADELMRFGARSPVERVRLAPVLTRVATTILARERGEAVLEYVDAPGPRPKVMDQAAELQVSRQQLRDLEEAARARRPDPGAL